MVFDIYFLDGLGPDQLAAMMRKPRTGDVVVKKRFPGSGRSELMVHIADPNKPHEPAMVMHAVQMIGMSGDSLVIEGTVGHNLRGTHKGKIEYSRHRWLLKPPGTRVVIDAEVLRKSKASLAAAHAADPFHPVWDDDPEAARYGPLDPSIM